MNKKLYVGNLPFDADESALKELFEAAGCQVASVQVITDRQTGRSRGFGFVELDSEDQAQEAIDGVNGKELMGRALVVNEAREQSRGPRNRGGFSGGGGKRGGRGGGGGGSRW